MGNKNTRSSLRNAIIHLNISAKSIGAHDDEFWAQIFSEDLATAASVIKGISTQEIRMLRDGSPRNFATLTYKMVERLCLATGTLCNTHSQQTAVLNATRILIRIIPCIFEDVAWRKFFELNYIDTAGDLRKEPSLVFPEKGINERNYASYLPFKGDTIQLDQSQCGLSKTTPELRSTDDNITRATSNSKIEKSIDLNNVNLLGAGLVDDLQQHSCPQNRDLECYPQIKDLRAGGANQSLMKTLILSICDLLFCPEFTVLPHGDSYLANTVDAPPEDLKSLSTCDYVWEPGVGFESTINSTLYYDKNRAELLRALLACLSVTLYETPTESTRKKNPWMDVFTSHGNRHTLPLLTSLLNVVFQYRPARPLLPFNSFLFESNREELVELSAQILIATLDYKTTDSESDENHNRPMVGLQDGAQNLFIEYLSRIHRSEDITFLIKGFARLLGNRLNLGNSLLGQTKNIEFDQELLILFWKICNLNKKFIHYFLKSSEILDIVEAILYHLNDNFQDPSKTALIHIGVFNLLILSSERNFGVRLNKPYTSNVLGNLPEFAGSHADLLVIVSHKLIMYGYNLNQLYDFLLTILVNISPYLKGLTMLASKCLIQLFETFSSTFVIFTEPNYHQLVVFLLEIFNNIIQYQFDGNTNLVYILLKRKDLFTQLANLPTSQSSIDKVFRRLIKRKQHLKLMGSLHLDQNKGTDTNQQSISLNGKDPTTGQHLNLATISSIGPPTIKTSQKHNKQEVSLVATPDLCHVTQPTHPFDVDSQPSEQSGCKQSHEVVSSQTACLFSFDDILDEASASDAAGGSLNSPSRHTNGLQSSSSSDSKPSKEDTRTDKISLMRHNIEEESRIGNISRESISCDDPTKTYHTGTGKWRPTPDWLRRWKHSLPLQTVLRMIEVLSPQIELINQEGDNQVETEMIKFLQNGTLVGLLPVPHPILIRKYRTNSGSTLWFRACTWGIIYVRNTIWTNTDIQLVLTTGR